MRIVEIQARPNGAHRNQSGFTGVVPDGWAVIPPGMELPGFPFGTVFATPVGEVVTVTGWAAGTAPVRPEEEPELTWQDAIEAQVTYTAMMTDTLLEV